MELKYKNYYQMIELAKKTVQDGSMDDEEKSTLIQSIEQLINLLSDESDFKIMLPKYEALAIMLQEVVVNNKNDGEAKLVAVDAFLQQLEQPSSRLTHNVSTLFHIGNFALVLIIPLVSFYIMPLIPFSAALALLGLTGDLLVCATIVVVSVAQCIGASALVCMYQLMAGWLKDPVSRLCQWGSSEYRTGKEIKEKLSLNFFAKDESSDKPKDEGLEPGGLLPSFA